ncbi:MAG: DNA translocase FtsK 4TM domain-containing protein, partial [Polyangiales bacterium]
GEPYARGRELGALLYVAAAAFLTLAIASYDERGGADWVGPVGASVARIFVSAVGLAAWAVPVELGLFAIPYLRRRASVTTPARMAGDVVLLATAAALIHVGAAGRSIFGGHLAGGVVGELFGELLRSLFSTVGTFLVGLTTIALVLIARATFSFIAFANRAGATSAAAANKAAASVKGVAEAWQQAKELDRGEMAPSLVSSGSGHDPESGSRISLDGDRASIEPGAPPSYDQSGVRAVSELRMRDDGAISPETHLIARQLAGVDLGADAMPGGPAQMPKSPPREPAVSSMTRFGGVEGGEIAPPILLGSPEKTSARSDGDDEKAKKRRTGKDREKEREKEKEKEKGPTIAPPSPEAAMQRVAERDDDEATDAATGEETGEETNADALVLASSESTPVAEEAEAPEGHDDEQSVEAPKPKRRKQTTRMAARGYQLPGNELLLPAPPELAPVDRAALIEDAKALVATLATYKVIGEVREIHPGPVVTTFELEPRIGTKVREVEGLANDLRLSLAKESVRIVAPIPGKNRIGFELPNAQRIPVNFRELVEDRRFAEVKGALPVVLGRDIVGAPFYADLAAMPHLLVAGATGAGKSVGLNVMLTSLLYRRTPDDLRMIMIDPKVVELAPFDKIPHMLLPVVTDMKQALNALKWCVDEMERRYQLLAAAGVKNITTYNGWRDKVIAGTLPNPCP